jgi:hypothetical protein
MRPTLVAVVAVAAIVPGLGGCSSDGTGSSTASSSSSSGARRGTTIEIVVKDGAVTPMGARVKASVGSPVTLHIDADTSGEIHVHSSPEQEIQFPQGTSTRRVTIDKPGIVDVEDHALDQVIVQLQVS